MESLQNRNYTYRMLSIFEMKMKSILNKVMLVLCAGLVTFGLSGCNDDLTIGEKIRVGENAPRSNNLTVANPEEWYKVSTMETKVPLYSWEIADLIDQGKPFLTVFGTPQHCTMCVDQIVRVAVMQEKYGDQFAFVHVDGYKDNDIWVEWGVKGEPWTYFVDQKGIVTQIYPGQTELGLLELNIEQLLNDKS